MAHQFPRTPVVHLADIQPRRKVFTLWERHRHREAHWFVECAAEALGVFFYVFFGVGAVAGFNIGGHYSYVGLQTVGFGFAFGIMLALVTCSATSGGHLNPGVTIAMVILKGFPPAKAARYIVAQIFGAYIAALLVYAQWHTTIAAVQADLIAKGTFEAINYTPQGLAGIFACYAPVGANLGLAFLNEFVCDFLIGVTIWACIDPTNFAAPPAAAPWILSLSYAVTIWGFAPNGISTNSARDLGTRFAVLTIWGTDASGGTYAAIAALANIPATFCGALFYEFVLLDSSRAMTPSHVSQLNAHISHQEHSQQGAKPLRQDTENGNRNTQQSSYEDDGKAHIETFERTSRDGSIRSIERA